ncbi:putative AC transposase [Bienertia sinuspersici]
MPCNPDIPSDILEYWQSQLAFFPVVSRNAKDILTVSITSVAAKSSLNMGGRVLTKYRSSLRTNNVEAFVTNQNWLVGYLKQDEVQDYFEVMKEVILDDINLDWVSFILIIFPPIIFISQILVNIMFWPRIILDAIEHLNPLNLKTWVPSPMLLLIYVFLFLLSGLFNLDV